MGLCVMIVSGINTQYIYLVCLKVVGFFLFLCFLPLENQTLKRTQLGMWGRRKKKKEKEEKKLAGGRHSGCFPEGGPVWHLFPVAYARITASTVTKCYSWPPTCWHVRWKYQQMAFKRCQKTSQQFLTTLLSFFLPFYFFLMASTLSAKAGSTPFSPLIKITLVRE